MCTEFRTLLANCVNVTRGKPQSTTNENRAERPVAGILPVFDALARMLSDMIYNEMREFFNALLFVFYLFLTAFSLLLFYSLLFTSFFIPILSNVFILSYLLSFPLILQV